MKYVVHVTPPQPASQARSVRPRMYPKLPSIRQFALGVTVTFRRPLPFRTLFVGSTPVLLS